MTLLARLAASSPTILPETLTTWTESNTGTILRDPAGGALAICRVVDGRPEVRMPALGRFVFSADRASAYLVEGRTERDLLEGYRRCGLPLGLNALGAEVLHASAVLGPRGVVALCGDSGVGKSTTAYGLARRGYRAWADDVLAFEPAGASYQSIGLPFEFRFLPDSIEWFRRIDHQPVSGRADARTESAPIAAIVVLERTGSGFGGLSRLSRSQAFRSVFPHAFVFDLSNEDRTGTMSHRYMELAASIPVFRAGIGNDLEEAPLLLDRLEKEVLGSELGNADANGP